MGQNRFSARLAIGVLIALFFGVALFLRIVLPYDKVFVGDWIKFSGVDAWHFMRQVDSLVRNFPQAISFDPYTRYPAGSAVGGYSLFVYFLGGITWLFGLGSPSQHTIDVLGAYLPAVVGALTVVPVYFLGKALFNRWAGIISAGILAIMPGEFLGRSILGFTDRHSVEVFLTVLTMLLFVLALKSAAQRQLSFETFRQGGRALTALPLAYSLGAGAVLGVYLLTWRGAFIFLFILVAFLILQSVVEHLRGRNPGYLCITSTVMFLMAFIIYVPFSRGQTYTAALAIAVVVPLALLAGSRLVVKRHLNQAYYPLALFVLGAAGLAGFYIISPAVVRSILSSLAGVFIPPSDPTTIQELRPILYPEGEFSLAAVWGSFTTGFFLSLLSLAILIYLVLKRNEPDRALLVVWSLVILAATLAMRRFAYHFAVNVALLTGYISWLVLRYAGFRDQAAETPEAVKPGKGKNKHKSRKEVSRLKASRANMAVGAALVLLVMFVPNIGEAGATASNPSSIPSDGWCESLTWLRENTPEPFGDPDFYYRLFVPPKPGQGYEYPATAYGVLSWWDYGYWITRLGQRPTNCDPGGGELSRKRAGRFFTSQDEESTSARIVNLGSKYIIIDYDMVTVKFHGMVSYAGSNKEDFYDVYYQEQGNTRVPVLIFYPEYYRSLAVRLYNFDAAPVEPAISKVISYEKVMDREGNSYKKIIEAKAFPSYEDAEGYIAEQKSGNYRLVGDDPFMSPIPLEALQHYRLVHTSTINKDLPPGVNRAVKVFEFTE